MRKAVGPRILLSIDYHHRLSVAEAAHFCQQVEDLHLHFVEEPIRCEDPKAYQQLRTMTNIPFAIGEEFSSKWAFAPYIEQGILNFSPARCLECRRVDRGEKIAGWCETHYIDLMPHNPLGPVTTAASVHLGIATNNFAMLEFQHRVGASYPRDLFPVMHELEGDATRCRPRPVSASSSMRTPSSAIPSPCGKRRIGSAPNGAFTNW